MKKLLTRSFWRGVWFYITFILSCIPINWKLRTIEQMNLTKRERVVLIQSLFRIWMFVFLRKRKITVEYQGLEKLPNDSNYILASRHLSFLDIFVLTPNLPPHMTLAKEKYSRYPILGKIWASLSILVDHEQPRSIARSYLEMNKLPKANLVPLFFPEGTRNTTKELLMNFNEGAFRMAIKQNIPVYMILLNNSNILSASACSFTPGKILVKILDPLYAQTEEDGISFAKRAQEIMLKEIEKL